ncbi:MAG: acetyl/propionyl/methylcrotonyl-CoA carboxylase subunit alpha [Gammaproteobacteria bacterium]|nr:acetyl/propionyl/methylcrotonyl-CoA carboxylase subunit alpha [Gammaproteobacteria bacterium]
MFTKILIANRGEIACRIITTAHKMGIKTVALYSEADKNSKHIKMADETFFIGPPPSRQSYLMADKILEAAKATQAQAIHPGYGFLSENAGFAKLCEDQGVVFIGPKHHSISAMGDKIASKILAKQSGVNTIMGFDEALNGPDEAVEKAEKIGYPVMLKASAGGGGKGLRIAFNAQEVQTGFLSCRNEAMNSFGDDRILIEKYIESPRHIEIQILADRYGNTLYLNERECSIQRRHQKVIEEAPSAFVTPEMRRAMGQQAVQLAKAVNYQSAGTVEFVVGRDRQFYFLEMNTRLQVEHPVTESITGLDLVEWMIRIAYGEKLTISQNEVKCQGWAIECRINAEDPERQFLPSTGRLVRFQPPEATMPAASPQTQYGVRIDTGVVEGGEIPMYYDSMVAKLIVHAENRTRAIEKMRESLNAFVVRGVSTNIAFHLSILQQQDFLEGNFDTHFIAHHYPQGFKPNRFSHPDPMFLVALAAFVRRKSRERTANMSGQLPGYEVQLGQTYTVITLGEQRQYIQVTIEEPTHSPAIATIRIGSKKYEIESHSRLSHICISGKVNGQPFVAQVERHSPNTPMALLIQHYGACLEALVVSPTMADYYQYMPFKSKPDMSNFIISPMPGLLLELAVKVGQKVIAGQRIAVIEAMKMENVLYATKDAEIKVIHSQQGSTLNVDQKIIEFTS